MILQCRQLEDELKQLEYLNTHEIVDDSRLDEIRDIISIVAKDTIEYDDELVRQIISKVRIISKNRISVTLLGGHETEVDL